MAPIKDSKRGVALNEQPRISKKSNTPRSRKLLQNRSAKAKSERQVGLPRPKSQTSYNIPRDIQELAETTTNDSTNPSLLSNHKNDSSRSASRSSTPIPSSDLSPLLHLSRIATLLDLIHRRNKNQHRNQNFYKWFSLLRRSIKNLTSLHQRFKSLNLKSSNKRSASNNNAGDILNAESIRKTYELRSELRSQIEVGEEWIRETLLPGCFISFSSVVADNQFANLGIVLMGILGDVVGHVGTMRRVDKIAEPLLRSTNTDIGKTKSGRGQRLTGEPGGKSRSEGEKLGRSILGVSTLITGPDQGEVVERIYSDVDADVDEEKNLDPANRKHIEDEGISIQRSRDAEEEVETPNNNVEPSSSTPATDKYSSPRITQSAVPSPSKSQLSPDINSEPKLESRPKQPARNPSSADTELVLESLKPRSAVSERREQKQDRKIEEEQEKASKVNAKGKDRDKDSETKKKKKKKGKGNAIDDLFGGLF